MKFEKQPIGLKILYQNNLYYFDVRVFAVTLFFVSIERFFYIGMAKFVEIRPSTGITIVEKFQSGFVSTIMQFNQMDFFLCCTILL